MDGQRDRHFRLPAERVRIRNHSPRRGRGRARRRRHRQHLRRHRRGRAPGAPGDPPRPPRAPRGARSSSPAAPPRSRLSATRRLPEVDRVLDNRAKLRAASYAPAGAEAAPTDIGRDRGASDRRLRGPRARLSAGPAGLRPPLHVLHHPLCARAEPLGADRRRRRAGAPAGRRRLSRDRADRCRPDRLWRRSAGPAEPRPDGAAPLGRGARARPAAAVVARPGRDRRRAVAADRRGRAADAASASVVAGRRRSDPEAHEAPAFARPSDRGRRPRPRAAARPGAWAPT